MSAVPNRALAEAERKLTLLLMEVRGTATFEQVKLYVAKFTNGRLLSDYLHDDSVAPKERSALATALIEILLTKDYSRLPALEPMQNVNTTPANPLPAVTPTQTTTRPTPQPTADRGAESPAEPHASPASAAPRADADEDSTPAPDEIRDMIRAEVRRELANIFDIAAKVLRETN